MVMKSGAIRQILPRLGVTAALTAAPIWALGDGLSGISLPAALAIVGDFDPGQWLLAIVATSVSFFAVGRFELVCHRHLRTGIEPGRAQRSGLAATAIGQCLGMNFLTGAVARWRLLPELSGAATLRVSALAAFAFVLCAGWLAALCLPMLYPPLAWVAVLPIVALLAMAGLSIWHPQITFRGMCLSWPTLPALTALLFWAALDTLAAAAALAAFLPVTDSFSMVYAAYLISLISGLTTGSPGGAGAFDMVFLSLAASAEPESVLAALLAFRLVYYALPGALAAFYAIWPHRPPAEDRTTTAFTRQPRRAEQHVLAQNRFASLTTGGSAGGAIRTGQTLVLYLGALAGCTGTLLPGLRREARVENRLALAYRITAQEALAARHAGWAVTRIADEAVVKTACYDLNDSNRRRLRRYLRKAEKDGIRIRPVEQASDIADMAAINHSWVRAHCRERGVTMGRFSAAYVRGQRVFLAWHRNRPVAFVSLHQTEQEWCLDLMRHRPDAPSGTMHALVHHAITEAAAGGVAQVSLAAAPCGPAWLAARAAGLRQFKSSFAPRWMPCYAAAPTRPELWLALADLARAVLAPPPLSNLHEQDDNYEFASQRAVWDRSPSDDINWGIQSDEQPAERSSRVA